MNLKRSCFHHLRWFGLLLLFSLASPISVFAQETEHHEAFVYGINAVVPNAVIGTFAPPAVDTIYLLAGETSIISPRITNIHYWPLTNEYRPSWSTLNEPVEGSLEIRRGFQKVAMVEQTAYTIHFKVGEGGGNEHSLFVGEEAITAHAQFEADQLAYQDAVLAYEEARQAWLSATHESQQQGTPSNSVQSAPVELVPLNTMSNGLNRGFPVNLDAGNYRIRTRKADGTIVPNSERRLVVFSPRRTTIGYGLLPEQRWTIPDESNEPESVILGATDTVVYLKPYFTSEYPSIPYHRLQYPQDTSEVQEGEWTWVAGKPIKDVVLERLGNGRVSEQIPLLPYTVRQTADVELGYEILPYDSSTLDVTPRVDFVAFRLLFTDDDRNFTVQLRSLDGTLLEGSNRAVHVASESYRIVFWLIGSLPLLVGGSILLWRLISKNADRISQTRLFLMLISLCQHLIQHHRHVTKVTLFF